MPETNQNNSPAPGNDTAALMARLEALEAGHSALQKENATLRKAVKIAEKPAAEKPKPTIPNETFEVDGKEYKFIVPAFRAGNSEEGFQDMTAQDALSDEAVLAHLVATKSGIITEVAA